MGAISRELFMTEYILISAHRMATFLAADRPITIGHAFLVERRQMHGNLFTFSTRNRRTASTCQTSVVSGKLSKALVRFRH